MESDEENASELTAVAYVTEHKLVNVFQGKSSSICCFSWEVEFHLIVGS